MGDPYRKEIEPAEGVKPQLTVNQFFKAQEKPEQPGEPVEPEADDDGD